MATTINTYSVGLTLDASEYINKVGLSATETRRLSRAIEQARDPSEKFGREQNRLNSALERGAINQNVYNRLLETARAKHLGVADSMKSANAQADIASRKYSEIGSKLKGLVAAYVGFNTITKAIRLAAEAEQAAAMFEILTGSVKNSNIVLSELRRYSDISPLTFGGVQNAAKTMLSFNIPVEKVIENIRMLGDISGGNQQRFDSLALAFSQMSAAGRLMGQDLLQMINTGFNPLQEISRKTGESLIDLKKRMEDGAISSQEVTEAFKSATSEGGKFAGMSDRLAETMGGKLAIANANIEKSFISLGEAMGPLVISITDGFNEGTSAIQKMIGAVEVLMDGIGFTVALTRDLAKSGNWVSLFAFDNENSNRFLDIIAQRDRDRAAAKMMAADSVFDKTDAGLVNTQIQETEISNNDKIIDQLKEQKSWQERINEAQLERARKLDDEFNDWVREAETAFGRDIEKAIDAANRHFEEQRRRDERVRSEISKGPGSGIESGTEAAAKFMADQINSRIGAAAMPQQIQPGDKEIISEAKKQFDQLQSINGKAAEQVAALRELIKAAKDNGFARIR